MSLPGTLPVITMMPTSGSFNYARIPELNGLMAVVEKKHGAMLDAKRAELLEIVRQCMGISRRNRTAIPDF